MIWVGRMSVKDSNRKKRNHATESSDASSAESVRVTMGNKSNDVSECKVVMVFDVTTGRIYTQSY
jgi:hypothetical protein